MSAWGDLEYAEIGAYKPGCFYSESFSGVPYENDFLSPRGVGRTDDKVPAGLLKTMRLVVLLHESSHLVHDLSLGTCLDLDYLMDLSDGMLKAALRDLQPLFGSGVRCPLLAAENRSQWLPDKKSNQAFTIIEHIEAYKNRLIGRTPGLARYAMNLHPVFRGLESSLDELSGLALLEGLVAAKTVSALASRAEDEADRAYLRACRQSLHVLPESLPEVYRVARHIFDETVGRMLLQGRSYRQDDWPNAYSDSAGLLCDIGFVYLADMALHIPPLDFQEVLIAKGKNTPDDFIPVKRFCRILATLLQWEHFPMGNARANPEFFYNELFDELAKEKAHCWPTIRETNDAWKQYLAQFKATRREAADGYRFRMLVEREKRPHSIIMGDSLSACWSQFIPVFHLTPTGFKTLRVYIAGDSWYVIPVEIPDMAVNAFFYKDYTLWKDMPDEVKVEDWDFDLDNAQLLRQEVIYRTLCRNLYNALLYKKSLTCPFAEQGCETAQPGCKQINDLATILDSGCSLYTYLEQDRLDPTGIHWL